ncbi:MAG: lipid-binding SYLF domain-containing protein, partial [Alphaproteobacteria bacterium]
MSRLATTAIALLTAAGVAFAAPTQPRAASVPQELVEKAKLTTEKLLKEPDFPTLAKWIKEAKGVLIVPSLLKASFIFGVAGGNGVLLARDKEGNWGYPAFYTVSAGSFGLQAGFQDAEVVFVIMTDAGLESVIDNGLKLGLEASMAIGPVGTGVSGATTSGFGADIYAFSKAVGLFGGVS